MTRMSEIPPDLAAEMTPAIRALVESLLERISQLESRLKKTPQNSSLPPSSQHPHAKPPTNKRKSKKKHGGQPGHAKCERPLLPSDDCHDVQTLKPNECRRCGTHLAGNDPAPLRHQVWELPEIKPLVTEYRRHRLKCSRCGESTCAQLPPGVPQGQSGPRLVALAGLLMACFRQSKRRTAMFLETVLGQPCSASLVVKMQHQVAASLGPTYDELAGRLSAEPRLNVDESPTKESNNKAWLWTFVAEDYTVFANRNSREAAVLDQLLGDGFTGVVTCDRARMYWRIDRLQWCWAHLQRDFQALIDHSDNQVRRLGHDLMRPTKQLFRQWSRCRDGTITPRGMKRLLAPLRREIEALLLRGVFSGNRRLTGMCKQLHGHRTWLWTFLDDENVQPTNNAAERALRHPVIWRKLSFGTQSAAGSRFVERMLSVIETCRQQSRDAFAILTTAIAAHFSGQPGPSLLPGA
jgi:transposase